MGKNVAVDDDPETSTNATTVPTTNTTNATTAAPDHRGWRRRRSYSPRQGRIRRRIRGGIT
jgi:hypothetical protein